MRKPEYDRGALFVEEIKSTGHPGHCCIVPLESPLLASAITNESMPDIPVAGSHHGHKPRQPLCDSLQSCEFLLGPENGKSVSTFHEGSGTLRSVVMTIPLPEGSSAPSAPKGAVFTTPLHRLAVTG